MSESGTINVIAVLKARPGKEAGVREMALSLVAPTLAEPGCLSYRPYEDPLQPGSWVVVEEWTDRAALDAHLAAPHLAVALEAGADLLAGPPEVKMLRALGD